MTTLNFFDNTREIITRCRVCGNQEQYECRELKVVMCSHAKMLLQALDAECVSIMYRKTSTLEGFIAILASMMVSEHGYHEPHCTFYAHTSFVEGIFRTVSSLE